MGWTNLQLVVTATQKYTTLEVGAENDSAGFGVDDISVKPLPSLTFSSITKGVNGYNLSWRSSSWVKYQLQSTSDLANGNWLNVGPAVAGNDQTITAPDPNPIGAGATRFYRLVLTH